MTPLVEDDEEVPFPDPLVVLDQEFFHHARNFDAHGRQRTLHIGVVRRDVSLPILPPEISRLGGEEQAHAEGQEKEEFLDEREREALLPGASLVGGWRVFLLLGGPGEGGIFPIWRFVCHHRCPWLNNVPNIQNAAIFEDNPPKLQQILQFCHCGQQKMTWQGATRVHACALEPRYAYNLQESMMEKTREESICSP